MRFLALITAAVVSVGVLLAGCSSGDGGCNVRSDACGEDPSYMSGGDGGSIDPSEYLERNETPVEPPGYEDSPEMDGYYEGYDYGYDEGHDHGYYAGYEDRNPADAEQSPGIKKRWFHDVDISKFSAGGPGSKTLR